MAGAAAAACLHAGAFWQTRYLGLEFQAAAAAAALAAACQKLSQVSASGQPAHGQQYCTDSKLQAFGTTQIKGFGESLLVKVMGVIRPFNKTYLSVLWLTLLAHKRV